MTKNTELQDAVEADLNKLNAEPEIQTNIQNEVQQPAQNQANAQNNKNIELETPNVELRKFGI